MNRSGELPLTVLLDHLSEMCKRNLLDLDELAAQIRGPDIGRVPAFRTGMGVALLAGKAVLIQVGAAQPVRRQRQKLLGVRVVLSASG